MSKYRVGMVIPLYMTNFIANTINYLKNTTDKDETVFCIVNDGIPHVKDYLETLILPENMYVVNLPNNRCFAGSNNAGFNSLLEKYPELEYIGSLNDDTIPKENWLSGMVETLDNNEDVALVTPQIRAILTEGAGDVAAGATFTYNKDSQMLGGLNEIETDTYTNLVCGFCFLCRVGPFKEVEFLDEGYQNGAEDMDLSLKFITNDYRMMVCAKAQVVHFGGKSRCTRANVGSEISQSIDLLYRKWGNDLTVYNDFPLD